MDNLSPEILNLLFSEWPILEKLSINKTNILVNGLVQMQKFGVDSFSVRTIDKQGRSAMFCTNFIWPKLISDEIFAEDFKKHVSSELVYSRKNKIKIVSRSGDKTHSSFLQTLEKQGHNNSIIVNDFNKNQIEITYFIANPKFPQDRDIILNNLAQLHFIKNNLDTVLQEIFSSKEFHLKKQSLLNSSAIDYFWHKDITEKKTVNLSVDNKEISLTVRELECLSLLRFGASNIFISDTLGISVETVKSHLQNAKFKMGVESRKELTAAANNESFTNIFKIIREG
jgi:DNA-binding CsgD family transcriptional regulator